MNMRRAARNALVAPLIVTGGILVLTLGTANVFAASGSTKTPITSSIPHEHEHVSCSPGTITEEQGQCEVKFVDKTTLNEPKPVGQLVCFTVNPDNAGTIRTGSKAPIDPNCAKVRDYSGVDKAIGTFTASDKYCGQAVITATEPAEDGQMHHTTITLTCAPGVSTTSALLPAGSPQPPAMGGWLLGALGVGAALVTGFAVRRRSAGQSA